MKTQVLVRIALTVYAIVLLTAGAFALAGTTGSGIDRIATPMLPWFSAGILTLIIAARHSGAFTASGDRRSHAALFIVAAALYLPWLIEIIIEDQRLQNIVAGFIALGGMWITFALADAQLVADAENPRSAGGTALQKTAHVLGTMPLMTLGSVLLLASLAFGSSSNRLFLELVRGQWVSADFGILRTIGTSSTFAGHAGAAYYGCAVLLALISLVSAAAFGFRSRSLRGYSLSNFFAGAAAILAATLITDFNFAWAALNQTHTSRFVAGLGALNWAVPFLLLLPAAVHWENRDAYVQRLPGMLSLFYLPSMLMLDVLMPELAVDVSILGLTLAFFGIEFLAFGYANLLREPEEMPVEMKARAAGA